MRESGEQGWWERYTDGEQAERFIMNAPARCTALETEAVRVRSFEVARVHGLLQAPEYTPAVLEGLPSERTDSEVDRLVVMAAQLRYRRVAIDVPNVTAGASVLHRATPSARGSVPDPRIPGHGPP